MRISYEGLELELESWEKINNGKYGKLTLITREELKEIRGEGYKVNRVMRKSKIEVECDILLRAEEEEIKVSSLESIIETVLSQVKLEKRYRNEDDLKKHYREMSNYKEYIKNDEVVKLDREEADRKLRELEGDFGSEEGDFGREEGDFGSENQISLLGGLVEGIQQEQGYEDEYEDEFEDEFEDEYEDLF